MNKINILLNSGRFNSLGNLESKDFGEFNKIQISDLKDDWISTEHIDRRIRYAGLLFDFGRPEKDTDYIITQHIKMPALRNKLLSIGNERTRFIATLCSPEMMEV